MTDLPLAAYVSTTFVLVITPGAATAVVVRNALEGGRRGGLATAGGVAAANALHAAAAGLGLAVLIHRSPTLFAILRSAGGVYSAGSRSAAYAERGEEARSYSIATAAMPPDRM